MVEHAHSSARTGKLVGWGIAVSSLLFLTIGIVLGARASAFISAAYRTVAVVVANEARPADHGETLYTPTFEYTGPDGRGYTSPSSISSTGYGFEIGEQVRVLVDSNDPNRVSVDSRFDVWMLPAAFSALGLIGSAAGLTVITISGRRTAAAREHAPAAT